MVKDHSHPAPAEISESSSRETSRAQSTKRGDGHALESDTTGLSWSESDPREESPLLKRQSTPEWQLMYCSFSDAFDQCCTYAEANLVILPTKSTWSMVWDAFLIVILIISAFYEPAVLALARRDSLADIIFNYLVDFSFTTDMVLTFFVAYQHSQESSSHDLWEKNLCKIARRYTAFPLSDRGRAGWFWLDLVSVFPGWFELTLRWVDPEYLTKANETTHVVRMFRFFRLIRMVRLTRISEVVEKVHARYGFPFYVTDVMKFVFITCLSCHWTACLWITIEGKVTRGYISWDSHEQESWLSVLIDKKGDCCTPSVAEDSLCAYILALYWAMMTLTGVGYGDITPQNSMEYFVSWVVILISGFLWAYIVGSVVHVLSQGIDINFRSSMDDLNDLMENRDLPDSLRLKLRLYLIESKHIPRNASQQHLLKVSLSSGTRQLIFQKARLTRILQEKVFWTSGLEEGALYAIAAAMQPFFYAAQESVTVRERMVIVQDGYLQLPGHFYFYRRDDVYGHDTILLESQGLASRPALTALTYVDLRVLQKEDLKEVCRIHPMADRRIRRAQIRTAVYLGFIRAAKDEVENGTRLSAFTQNFKHEHATLTRGPTFASMGDEYEDMIHHLPALLQSQKEAFHELLAKMQQGIVERQWLLSDVVLESIMKQISEVQAEIEALDD